jgi:hypothetical protein
VLVYDGRMARLLALVLVIIALSDVLAAGLLFAKPIGQRVQIQREAGAWLDETLADTDVTGAEMTDQARTLAASIDHQFRTRRTVAIAMCLAHGLILLVIAGLMLRSGEVTGQGLMLALGAMNILFALTLQPAMRLAMDGAVHSQVYFWAMEMQRRQTPLTDAATDEQQIDRAFSLATALARRVRPIEDDFNRPLPLVQGLALVGVFAAMPLIRRRIASRTGSSTEPR